MTQKSDPKPFVGIKIIPRPNGTRKVELHTGRESHVQQAYKEECDVNNIVARFKKTGELPNMVKGNPEYGDYSDPVDYQAAHNILIKAAEQFSGLSAETRKKFDNDPARFLEWAGDSRNKKEMAHLGLLTPEAAKSILEQIQPTSETPAPKNKPKAKNESETD